MSRKRTKQIVIRLSDAEYDAVKMKVSESGMSQQSYLIKAITNKKIINTDGLKEFARQVKPIGGNLNYMVKHFNQGYQIRYDLLVKMYEEFKEVWQLLRQSTAGQASATQ